MIYFPTAHFNHPIAIFPDMVESVEVDGDSHERCFINMASGNRHHIQRTFATVTAILRAHDNN